MALVTLITDLGTRDYYAAAIKGAIISHCEAVVPVVDVTHHVKPFDIREAAYTLRNSYKYFPKGTIHVIHVNSSDAEGRMLLAKMDGHYFLTFDNGILSLAFGANPKETYEVNSEVVGGHSLLFEEAIGTVINFLLTEYKPTDFAHLTTTARSYRLLQPMVNPTNIRGTIVYVDNYGNAISNIPEKMFLEFTKGKRYSVMVNVGSVKQLSNTYSDVDEGDILCLINTSGFLEIAINKGKAANLLGLKEDSAIIVTLD
ncbi:MAG: SAM-dependent chlorinase/fluorinase [Chitinophagales bacterium]|nr:SAM-dependent chlorinase/fluorinase [Chitinophagales bacterium]